MFGTTPEYHALDAEKFERELLQLPKTLPEPSWPAIAASWRALVDDFEEGEVPLEGGLRRLDESRRRGFVPEGARCIARIAIATCARESWRGTEEKSLDEVRCEFSLRALHPGIEVEEGDGEELLLAWQLFWTTFGDDSEPAMRSKEPAPWWVAKALAGNPGALTSPGRLREIVGKLERTRIIERMSPIVEDAGFVGVDLETLAAFLSEASSRGRWVFGGQAAT